MRTVATFLIIVFTLTPIDAILLPQGVDQYPSAPVWTGYLADPFAFEFNGTYYMIGTGLGLSESKDTFPSLMSTDLITWTYMGDVLHVKNEPGQPAAYWAPEIAQSNNVFYLFYSAGFGEKKHRLRVASSAFPLGPFDDSTAIELTDPEKLPFAIDPHPFQDPKDEQWYLFYSRDFLDQNNGYRVGTGIVVDRLVNNMSRLAGDEHLVLRARHDWQMYEAQREIYNGTYDWHTLEGAATWQQESNVYVCFYSGGNWQKTSYGVDYGVSYTSPLGPYYEDSTNLARITHSINGVIIGPGHNSIILGPDKRNTYLVYHAWNEEKTIRSPYVSRLSWEEGRGPTSTGSANGQDFLRVTLVFLVYLVVVMLIFYDAF